MGCFNKIGFVSNLPITAGDKTVLIFTTVGKYRKSEIGGVTSSDDAYTPTLLPIFGEYDDYGKIECIVRDKNVEYIENFFGIDIDELVEVIDNHSVGRHCEDCKSVPKNKEIFENMTFCLEHQEVYEKMASSTRPSFRESNIGEYWLEKLGWIKDGKTTDTRYKYKWIHPQVPNAYIACDDNWVNFKVKGEINNPIFDFYSVYNPCDLYKVMEKLNLDIPIIEEDKNTCMIDLSYDITGNIFKQKLAEIDAKNVGLSEEASMRRKFERRYAFLDCDRWPKGIFSIPEMISNRQNVLSKLIKNIIAGINDDVPEMDATTLTQGMRKNVCDYIRFNYYFSCINGKYFPSNYGSQDTSLEMHSKMNKIYAEILDAKLAEQRKWQEEDEEIEDEI